MKKITDGIFKLGRLRSACALDHADLSLLTLLGKTGFCEESNHSYSVCTYAIADMSLPSSQYDKMYPFFKYMA